MFNQLVHNFMKPRHFWRKIDMSELSELYASMLFRSLALSLVGLFVQLLIMKLAFCVAAMLSIGIAMQPHQKDN